MDEQSDRLRSPIRYFGGKGNMLAKLMPLVPQGGRPYCEPFCGGASLFFRRDPAPVEVLNDLNEEIVNLFRCLQDRATFEELRHRIMWTPYARAEFVKALGTGQGASAIDRAWATFVKFNMGYGGVRNLTPGQFSRAFITNGGAAATTNLWLMRLSMLDAFHHRLMRVQIDCVDAIQCIRYWDSPNTVFYVDPPYLHATRTSRNDYSHEMTDEQHTELVKTLLGCKGSVTLSGYNNSIYAELDRAGWKRFDFQTGAYAAARNRNSRIRGTGAALKHAARTECVWINSKAMEKLGMKKDEQPQVGNLFLLEASSTTPD